MHLNHAVRASNRTKAPVVALYPMSGTAFFPGIARKNEKRCLSIDALQARECEFFFQAAQHLIPYFGAKRRGPARAGRRKCGETISGNPLPGNLSNPRGPRKTKGFVGMRSRRLHRRVGFWFFLPSQKELLPALPEESPGIQPEKDHLYKNMPCERLLGANAIVPADYGRSFPAAGASPAAATAWARCRKAGRPGAG